MRHKHTTYLLRKKDDLDLSTRLSLVPQLSVPPYLEWVFSFPNSLLLLHNTQTQSWDTKVDHTHNVINSLSSYHDFKCVAFLPMEPSLADRFSWRQLLTSLSVTEPCVFSSEDEHP